MRTLLRYFAQGVLVAVPIALTVYVAYRLVTFIDGLLRFPIPGLGLAVTLALLTLLGFITSSVIGSRLVTLAEGVFKRLPLVKILYSALKDLIGAFVGDRKGFDRPVAVQLPGGQGRVFGFATRDDVPFPGFEQHVLVYFPQSFNFAGNLVAVPRASVTPLDVKSSDFMSFVISAGIAGVAESSSSPEKPLPAR